MDPGPSRSRQLACQQEGAQQQKTKNKKKQNFFFPNVRVVRRRDGAAVGAAAIVFALTHAITIIHECERAVQLQRARVTALLDENDRNADAATSRQAERWGKARAHCSHQRG